MSEDDDGHAIFLGKIPNIIQNAIANRFEIDNPFFRPQTHVVVDGLKLLDVDYLPLKFFPLNEAPVGSEKARHGAYVRTGSQSGRPNRTNLRQARFGKSRNGNEGHQIDHSRIDGRGRYRDEESGAGGTRQPS